MIKNHPQALSVFDEVKRI